MKPKSIVIFHSVDGVNHCDDGFAAAYAAWTKHGDSLDYYPGVYQQDPPDVVDREVYLLDFSYKAPVLREMAKSARRITVLDHHATAQDDLTPLLEEGIIEGEFDMTRSGCVMAWEYFSTEKLPDIFAYIQDRDLWKKELADGDKVIMALRSYPKTFEAWAELPQVETLIEEGRAIHRYYRVVVDGLKANARMKDVFGYTVPVVNCPMMFASETAGEIAEGHEFGACYWDDADGNRVYSLRSDGRFHVGKFASLHGGGGHAGAAGFKVTPEEPVE